MSDLELGVSVVGAFEDVAELEGRGLREYGEP